LQDRKQLLDIDVSATTDLV